MPVDIGRLVARAEDDDTDAVRLRAFLGELLVRSPGIGVAVALGLLAREPRIKPSRHLLIDPSDLALHRWQRRVASAAALASSAVAITVAHELDEEFRNSPDLESDAQALVTGVTGVT